jgi:Carboxypeptidase regulatory-like domain
MQMNGLATLHRRLPATGAAALAALFAVAAATAPARALNAPVPVRRAVADTIQGIVFDSLMHAPLEGATVQADAGTATTMTDREGRFTLIAPDSIHQVTVFHDLLDRTGLGSLVKIMTPTTSRSRLILSTPSFATIWARLCPGKEMDKGHAGIVFGVARAEDARTRVVGALVRVSWDFDAASDPASAAPARGGGSGIGAAIGAAVGLPGRNRPVRVPIAVPHLSDAKTDSTGTYFACGTPPNLNVYAAAYSSTLRSGGVTVQGDSLPLRRVDLVLGEVGKTATIHGVVRGPSHEPLSNATVEIDGAPDLVARTDPDGRFTLSKVPTGSRTLLVRALPYSPTFQPVAVVEKQNDEIEIDMLRQVTLPSVKVTGLQNRGLIKLDFEQRRREGFGIFRDSTEIEKLTSIRSIFQGMLSVTVAGTDESAFYLFGPTKTMSTSDPASGCQLNVYIDGQLSDTSVLITLPQASIAAVEVYTRMEFAPAKYILLQNDCGIVLVWTKLSFNR